MKKFLLLPIAVLVGFMSFAQQLTAVEKQIVEEINRNYRDNLRLLQQSVDINSGSLNIQGVRAVGDHMAAAFQKIGFTTEWVSLPDSLKRAGHLVAYKKGTKGKRIFMIGHLDTVFEPDMQPDPFRYLNDSTVTGQGVADMKGGNIIMLAACQALSNLGLLNDATVVCYFTGDEESTGQPDWVSRLDFIKRAKECDIALAFEGAEGLNKVAIGRRGIGSWKLEVVGKQGHSSQIFKADGFGANFEMARILNEIRSRLSNIRNLTFNPGIMGGGSDLNFQNSNSSLVASGKTNIIADTALAMGDLRYLTLGQRDSARKIMRQIATTKNLKGTKATITFADGFPSMEPKPGNYKLVKAVNDVNLALGFGPVVPGDPGSRGAGDISWVAQYVDCIDGLGAEGEGAHAPGEYMKLNTFPKLMQRTAVLLYRLTR